MDETEEGAAEFPYCDAVPGTSPHNFQPVIDPFGTGLWLFCTQCGDHVNVDGTAQAQPLSLPGFIFNNGTPGTPSPAAGPGSAAPPGTTAPKSSGLPFG